MATQQEGNVTRRRALGSVIFGLISSWVFDVTNSTATEVGGVQGVLEERGKRLQEAVLSEYRNAPSINTRERFGIDIGGRVSEFIPAGTSFGDAKTILKSAGFEIAQWPPGPIPPHPSALYDENRRFLLVGTSELSQGFFTKVVCYIYVHPVDHDSGSYMTKSVEGNIALLAP